MSHTGVTYRCHAQCYRVATLARLLTPTLLAIAVPSPTGTLLPGSGVGFIPPLPSIPKLLPAGTVLADTYLLQVESPASARYSTTASTSDTDTDTGDDGDAAKLFTRMFSALVVAMQPAKTLAVDDWDEVVRRTSIDLARLPEAQTTINGRTYVCSCVLA